MPLRCRPPGLDTYECSDDGDARARPTIDLHAAAQTSSSRTTSASSRRARASPGAFPAATGALGRWQDTRARRLSKSIGNLVFVSDHPEVRPIRVLHPPALQAEPTHRGRLRMERHRLDDGTAPCRLVAAASVTTAPTRVPSPTACARHRRTTSTPAREEALDDLAAR